MTERLKKIPLKVWFFVFSLSVFLMTILAPLIANATASGVEKYDHNHTTLRGTISKYHKTVNELMNDATDTLLNETDAITTPPIVEDSEAAEQKACDDKKNVSTYCLSYRMTNEFMFFYKAMTSNDENSHLSHFIEEEEKDQTWYNSELIDLAGRRQDLIQEQIVLAEDVLKASIDAYNEMVFYYQLHLAYAEVLADLETYRDDLGKIRTQVKKYPSNFHNVSTTECT